MFGLPAKSALDNHAKLGLLDSPRALLAGIEQRYLEDSTINHREFRHYSAIDAPNTRVGFFLPPRRFNQEVNNTVKALQRLNLGELTLLNTFITGKGVSELGPVLCLFPTNLLFAKVGRLFYLKPMARLVLGFQPDPKKVINPFNSPPDVHLERGKEKCDINACEEELRFQLKFRKILDTTFESRHELAIEKALSMAKEAHGSDTRRNGEPYVIHPIECATMLLKLPSCQVPWIIAGLLHDVAEDTTYFGDIQPGGLGFDRKVRAKLEQEFDKLLSFQEIDSLATTLLAVTKKSVDSAGVLIEKTDSRQDGHSRAKKTAGGAFIKLVDRLHNTSTIDVRDPPKILKTARETLEHLMNWMPQVRREYHILAACLGHENELAINLANLRLTRQQQL